MKVSEKIQRTYFDSFALPERRQERVRVSNAHQAARRLHLLAMSQAKCFLLCWRTKRQSGGIIHRGQRAKFKVRK